MTYKMDKDNVVFLVFVAAFMFYDLGPALHCSKIRLGTATFGAARTAKRAIVKETAAP